MNRAMNVIVWAIIVAAGFIYPIYPKTGMDYQFAGVGTSVSVSQEIELIFRSDEAYGLKLNGEVIKNIAEELGYIHFTLRPGQKIDITGSPWNQKVYVAYADPHQTMKVIETKITRFGWAHMAASPFAAGALVLLIWGFLFQIPVKSDGMWVNLWLAIQFRKQDRRAEGDRYPEVMTAIGKHFEVIAYPLIIWISICFMFPIYIILVFLQALIFNL